jgi:hypothetical protein
MDKIEELTVKAKTAILNVANAAFLHGEFHTKQMFDVYVAASDEANAAIDALASQLAPPSAPQQAWISVEERLPESGTECLVWGRAGWEKEPSIKMDRWDEQHEAPLSFSSVTIPVGQGWDAHDDDSVTHWMPLPQPPQQQTGTES